MTPGTTTDPTNDREIYSAALSPRLRAHLALLSARPIELLSAFGQCEERLWARYPGFMVVQGRSLSALVQRKSHARPLSALHLSDLRGLNHKALEAGQAERFFHLYAISDERGLGLLLTFDPTMHDTEQARRLLAHVATWVGEGNQGDDRARDLGRDIQRHLSDLYQDQLAPVFPWASRFTRPEPVEPRPRTDPDEAPIFVLGTGRSGTTLLRQMLNAHPRIYITHEAFFYAYLHHAPHQAVPGDYLARYFETFSFAWLQVDPEEVLRELPAELPPSELRQAFRAIMRVTARKFGKTRYGEKSPLDPENLGRIFKDFPSARVIYIMRDPRATVASLNRMPFATSSILLNSYVCARQLRQIRPFLDRIYELRLEDLAADPRRSMQGVLEYVGEAFDEAVLSPAEHAPADDVAPFPWFRGARRNPSPLDESRAWREQLGPAWIRTVERMNRSGLERYGYALAELEAEPDQLTRLQVGLREAPEIARSLGRLGKMARRLKRHFRAEETLDPQTGMELHVQLNPGAWEHYPGFAMPEVPRRSPCTSR